MHLSVIFPTRNRAKLLDKALNSVSAQTFPQNEFEVIVVDNGSTDDTKRVCASHEKKIVNLRYIFEKIPGLHVGRNAGFKAARGEILVYADDDIRAFPTWLEGIYETFRDPRVALAGGKNLPDFEIDPPRWVNQLWAEHRNGHRFCTLFSILDFGDEIKEISPFFVWGCNYSIRKSVLRKIGGFHPDGMPKEYLQLRGDGETAVSQAIDQAGHGTVYNPKASVYHWVSRERMTLSYVRHRAFLSGVSHSYFTIRHRKRISMIDDLRMATQYLKMKTGTGEFNIRDGKKEFYRAYEQGYLDGYHFHRNRVKSDPDLLRWVLKENYLD